MAGRDFRVARRRPDTTAMIDPLADPLMGPAPFGAIEPFGFPDPGRLMANMDRQLDQARPQGVPRDIPVDVKEKDDRFEVEAEVPGVPKESINVEVDNNVVYLNIERKEEQEEGGEDTQWHRTERRFGQVKRAFRLPETADTERVDGSVENGILRLNIPKRARDQGTRRRIALH